MTELRVAKIDAAGAMSLKSLGHVVDRKEAERVERLALALSDKAPPWAAKLIKKAAPVIGWAAAVLEIVGPLVAKFYTGIYKLYIKLPQRGANILCGMGIAFFGGRYAVAIAAFEAFNNTGGSEVYNCINDLHTDLVALAEANAADDKVDADGDGIADVDQVGKNELVTRKMALVLRTVDPERMSRAISGVYSGYMGVLVVLKFQFARTVALSHSIADSIRPAAAKVLAPTLLYVTPKEYHQWVNPIINVVCKSVALSIAWKIQMVISSVQSAMKGGLIVSRNLLGFLHDRKMISFGHEDTMIDEVIGWGLAGGGIYYQLWCGGPVPWFAFPITWPLNMTERWLQWSVTYMVPDKEDSSPK